MYITDVINFSIGQKHITYKSLLNGICTSENYHVIARTVHYNQILVPATEMAGVFFMENADNGSRYSPLAYFVYGGVYCFHVLRPTMCPSVTLWLFPDILKMQ